MDLQPLKSELISAAKLKEPAERSIRIAAIIAEALRSIGQDPILVGGAAVEFYTQGGYTTSDIDMLAEGGPELIKVMAELGFKKLGKDFTDDENKIYVEFPGDGLSSSERAIPLVVANKKLRILSLEDVIVDRLCSFKFWKSGTDGLNALKLMEANVEDRERLLARVQEEDVSDALALIQEIRETVIRRKIKPAQARSLLEKRMRELKK
ncbi:MAG TPA: hypothetical protein VJP40_02530 [bacterium]|nr:hypothetical protein [bacterium]